MNARNNLFLRARPWHLFLLFTAIMAAVLLLPPHNKGTALSSIGVRVTVFSISVLVLIGWFWSIGTFITKLLQATQTARAYLFAIACLYPVLYVPIFFALPPDTEASINSLTGWLSFLYIICFYYIFYFLCRSFSVLENGQAKFRLKYVGIFLSLWFFPVGAWVIQPKINQLLGESELS